MNNNFKEGQRITFDIQTIKGKGIIRGIATTEQPVLGKIYIVELCEKLLDYEYSHIAVPAINTQEEVETW